MTLSDTILAYWNTLSIEKSIKTQTFKCNFADIKMFLYLTLDCRNPLFALY